MEFRRGILFIRLKGDLNKNTIKGVIDEDFKYVVLNLDNMYSIDSYSIKYINKIRKNIEYEVFAASPEIPETFICAPSGPTKKWEFNITFTRLASSPLYICR